MCKRRLSTDLPGFESPMGEFDADTGLPRGVRVAGLGIPMVLVTGGAFEMGSERLHSAEPVHTVRVGIFYFGKYELSQTEWKSLMGTNPSAHQGAEFRHGERMPAKQVSWRDCQALVKEINEHVSGGGFRLPTEAEWEYAATVGASSRNAFDLPAPIAADVGPPSRLGLFRTLGNVWEWCSSLHTREDPSAPGLRVLRGGSYAESPGWLDTSTRHAERPDRRLPWYGVRLARDVSGERSTEVRDEAYPPSYGE